MEHVINDVIVPTPVANVLEDLRGKIAALMGITLYGNRLTMRWTNSDGRLVQVSTIIVSVDDG